MCCGLAKGGCELLRGKKSDESRVPGVIGLWVTMIRPIDCIEVINRIADNCTDLVTAAALREAQTALKRLEKIRAHHHRYEKTTDGGMVVYPSIHGHVMHRLLYGDVDEI